MPTTPTEAARVVGGLSEGDLEQRRVLIGSDFDLIAYSSAALRWVVAPRTAMAAGKGTSRIGIADVQDIPQATGAFPVLDNRTGSGAIRPSVVRYLPTDHRPVFGACSVTEH